MEGKNPIQVAREEAFEILEALQEARPVAEGAAMMTLDLKLIEAIELLELKLFG